jgi:hypothetical protein
MVSFGMLRRVTLVRTDVSEELRASIIRVTRIDELGTLAVTSNRHGPYKSHTALTSQKTQSFTVTATKTSNLTKRDKVVVLICLSTMT